MLEIFRNFMYCSCLKNFIIIVRGGYKPRKTSAEEYHSNKIIVKSILVFLCYKLDVRFASPISGKLCGMVNDYFISFYSSPVTLTGF